MTPADDGAVRIRRARPSDRDAIYDVCLRTGDAGGDASGIVDDRDLFGDVWVGAYLALRPDLVFVAEDRVGVAGYIVGTDDTAGFAATCEAQWWPPLRARYGDAPDGGELTPTEVLRRHVHHPPPAPPPDVLVDHPAHLHVNLLPRAQGHGAGRRLLETLFDALIDVPGVHLGVHPRNARAASFYLHHGFVPVGPARGPGQGWLLGRRLPR
ncbi:MAG: GNAT family N-acetyltransferase [Ilumatobacteraceae bacterium]